MKEIINDGWNFILYDKDGLLILSVICGTIGLYEINYQLSEDEEIEYQMKGTKLLNELAEKIRNNPEKYITR